MRNFSWREFVVDRLLSLPPEELRRIGIESGLIGLEDPETAAQSEVAALLMRRAAAQHREQVLVAAVYRTLGLEVPEAWR